MGKTGRRIWYGIAMFLSGLVLLLSAVGIAGVWITERALADTAVQMLEAVGNVTERLREATKGVDQKLERMQEVSTFISTASDRLSQKVIDKGVFLLLLPEEKEQNLIELSSSVKEAVSPVRDVLTAGLGIYRTIDQLPFINLPSPSQEQVDQLEESVGGIQSTAESLESEIAAFRSGTSDQIGKITSWVDQLTERLGESRDRLANLDTRLAIVQETLVQLQQTVVRVLVLVTILVTLLLAWVIYSQVEVIRLYRQYWKASGTESRAEGTPDQTAGGEDVAGIESGSSAAEISESE